MAKYRYKDKQEVNEHGQTLGYAVWMGGTEVTYIGGIVCENGERRNWFKTGEPETYFSIPGYMHVKGKKVMGSATVTDGLWRFVERKVA